MQSTIPEEISEKERTQQEANLAAMLNHQLTLPEYKGIQSNSSTLKEMQIVSPKSSLLDKTNGEP